MHKEAYPYQSKQEALAQFDQIKRENPEFSRKAVQGVTGAIPGAGVPLAGAAGYLQSPSGTYGGTGASIGTALGQLIGGSAGVGVGRWAAAPSKLSRGISMVGGGLLGSMAGGALGSIEGFTEGVNKRKTASSCAFSRGYNAVLTSITP